jgi:acyl-CoA thioester hydrolase
MAEPLDTYRGTVYPWQCDHMSHMNVMWYVGKFDEATWWFLSHLGLTPAHLRDAGRGMAAVDQRISYQRELQAGDVVTVRSGALEVAPRKIRFFHEMKNGVTGEVAAVTLLTGVYLDTAERKSTTLPEAVMARAREHIVDYPLPWPISPGVST